MPKYYILEGRTPVPVDNLMEWGKRFQDNDRRLLFDTVCGIDISTVFLGLDHSWGGGPPLLFETMVFGGEYDQEQWRYSTYDDAVEGHAQLVQMVQDHIDNLALEAVRLAERPEPKYPTKGIRVIRIRGKG